MILPAGLMNRKPRSGGLNKTLIILGGIVAVLVLLFVIVAVMSGGVPEQTQTVVEVPFN